MTRVVHFEILADEPERAVGFYQQLLGWQFQAMPEFDYWLIKTGDAAQPGIDGGLMKRDHPAGGDSVIAYICTISVEDIDAITAKVVVLGGAVTRPKVPIPGVGWHAYCRDTEGNRFGLMQPDTDAA